MTTPPRPDPSLTPSPDPAAPAEAWPAPGGGGLALAADIGGTFTDVVLTGPDGRLWSTKLLTTHDDPLSGLLEGAAAVLDQAGARPADVDRVVHGTTLATNVILERKGAPVAFVTTQGFGSMLELGRQARIQEERYDLGWQPSPPPVPPERTFEVPERVGPRGEEVQPLDEDAVARVVAEIATLDVAAVAICLLHAYADPTHERRVAELCRKGLPDDVLVICSTDILVEMREHDRAVTTVMSAAVAPVMSAYLTRLERGLQDLGLDAPLYVMTSSGEVLSAGLAARQAIATVESGPAAGVMAAQQIGRVLGRPDVLSLDMGGTTAKAAIVRDGQPDITPTFNVGGSTSSGGRQGGGGLTVKMPAIDLAEVGAGGGSIAWVDTGGALRVGPRSAGSVPGPACYGLGGTEATVTDANLVLGYLVADGFAGGTMALDPERAVQALTRHVAEPLGVTVEEAAAAVHELANAAMAGAIAVVTVQRGIDPRHFALVALGGAGPVHAARLAERFGVGTVIVPAAAGVGSAVGLLESDLGYERSATVMARTTSIDADELTAQLDALAVEAATALAGVDRPGAPTPDRPTPAQPSPDRVERRADVRFRGQSHEVSLPLPPGPLTAADLVALEASFHRFQLDTYGIHLEDPTELVAVRARVVMAASRRPATDPTDDRPTTTPVPRGQRRIHLEEAGGFVTVPEHRREDLHIGQQIAGPAVITAAETTVVVPPAWAVEVAARDHLVLRAEPSPASTGAAATASHDATDPLTAEVFRNALVIAAEEASIVVVKGAHSTFIVEGADAAAAILDAEGRLVAHSISTSLAHGASLRSSLPHLVAAHPVETMAPGDVFVLNDVFKGGIHANDLIVFRPVFVDGVARWFTGSLIHVADLGGLSAGGMAADATDVFLEGLQLPPVRLADTRGFCPDMTAVLAANSRQPDRLLGDVRALVAGTAVSARRVEELIARHGADGFTRGVEAFWDYAERRTRLELAGLAEGTYRSEYPIDDDGFHRGQPLWVRVAVEVGTDRVRVDLTGTDPQVPAAVNAGASQVQSGLLFAVRSFLDPTIPMNEGCFRAIEVHLPAGSLVNPDWPHPGGGRYITVSAAIEATYSALSQAAPDHATAASGLLQGFSMAGTTLDGRNWLHMAFDYGGSGARIGADGIDAAGGLFGGGRNLVPQIEPIEAALPVRVASVELLADSGGTGRWRGGRATRTVIEVLADAVVDTRGDRIALPPPGFDGGGPGRAGSYRRRRHDGTEEELPTKATKLRFAAGEALVMETSGGGGLGSP